MPKRPTMHEVAKVTGVSTSTVSRAISGSPLVADDVKDRILKAARKVGYRPYVRRVSAPVRVHTPEPPHLKVIVFGKELSQYSDGSFTVQLSRGIQAEALRSQDAKVSMQSIDQACLDSRTLDFLSRSDGLILMCGTNRHMDCMNQILQLNVPVVVAGREVPNNAFNCVNTESYNACRHLADYLFNMGFRRFGWFGGPREIQHFENRLAMMRGYLACKGIQIHPKDCRFFNHYLADEVLSIMDEWISENDLPEILICACGYPVVCVQRAMASHGMACPDDLSLVCFANSELMNFCHPQPTRMTTFPEEIGRRAYRRILELIQNERERQSPETILIPTKFIEGKSVRPPKR